MMSMSYTAGHIFSWPMSIAPAVNQLNFLDHLFTITKARSSVSQMRVCVCVDSHTYKRMSRTYVPRYILTSGMYVCMYVSMYMCGYVRNVCMYVY